jgi:DUF1680 family protein
MRAPGDFHRWPHAVLFRALMAHHSATGDARIVPALARHYLSNTSPHSAGREVCNVEALLWTYEQTGDKRLLDHALQAYNEYNRLSPDDDTALKNLMSSKRATEHGVTFNEIGKLGAVLYRYTGNETYLQATLNAYRKLDRDQMLVDGVPSSSEHLRGKDPLDSHETCDIADYTWGVGYLLLATGQADYADKIERACFNAAPGAVRSDFKALQYYSCPNQIVADASSNHNLHWRGSAWMSFRPNPGTECCPGDLNRIMPNYVARMWLSDGKHGLVAAMYGPSRVTATVSKGQTVTLVEKTSYPFSEQIEFEIHTAAPVRFALHLRIPGWCRQAQVMINGRPITQTLKPASFVTLRRTFAAGDRVTLILPMKIKTQTWPRGGLSVERGPLAYALRVEEDWRIDPDDPRSTPEFPAWNLYPASRWNYALALDPKRPEQDIEVIHHPATNDPWSIRTAPIELRVPARRVAGWRMVKAKAIISQTWAKGKFKNKRIQGQFSFTPQLPGPDALTRRLGKRLETISLVPYGCTKLRIAVFPHAPNAGRAK